MRSRAKPVIVAGSLDRAAHFQAVIESGAVGFNDDIAALDGAFPASRPGLTQQLLEIQMMMTRAV